jgi:hypothetical protein
MGVRDVRGGDAAHGAELGLLALMTGISEEHYFAGWMTGLEFDLWRARETGPLEYGRGAITRRQCDLLRLLSEEAGGWWVFDMDRGPIFLHMAEWLERAAGGA